MSVWSSGNNAELASNFVIERLLKGSYDGSVTMDANHHYELFKREYQSLVDVLNKINTYIVEDDLKYEEIANDILNMRDLSRDLVERDMTLELVLNSKNMYLDKELQEYDERRDSILERPSGKENLEETEQIILQLVDESSTLRTLQQDVLDKRKDVYERYFALIDSIPAERIKNLVGGDTDDNAFTLFLLRKYLIETHPGIQGQKIKKRMREHEDSVAAEQLRRRYEDINKDLNETVGKSYL